MKSLNLLSLLIILILGSCKKGTIEHPQNNSCPQFNQGNARYMFAPDSAAVNSAITVTFAYENQVPCQQFSHFLSSTTDSTTTVVINSKTDTCNCVTNYSPTFVEFSYMAPSAPGHSIIQSKIMNIVQHSDTIVIY